MQACPERRNIVYISLTNGVDISKFILKNNESFVLKPGVFTTTIKHVSKREVNAQVFGLHPDTNAHGKVNPKDPVIYGVCPVAPGSTVLAGKRTGTESTECKLKDGEKEPI